MIVVFSVLALYLCGALWRLLSFRDNTVFETSSNYSLVQEKEFAAEEINALSVRYANSADVFFRESDGDTVVVREYMNFSPEEKYLSTIKVQDSTLVIQGKKRNFNFIFFPGFTSLDSYTEILLPENLCTVLEVQTVSGNIRSELSITECDSFSASSTSGDIFFPSVEAQKLSVSSTSGDIRIDRAAGGKVLLSTTSGDIFAEQLNSDGSVSTTSGDISLTQLTGDCTVSTTSGEVRIDSAEGNLDAGTVSGDIRLSALDGTFSMNTTSGTVTVSDGRGQGSCGTVSGDVRLSFRELTGSLTLNTTSGNVALALPEAASFTFAFDTTSGECRTFFDDVLSFNKKGNQADGQYGEPSGAELNISTVSGDLRITKYGQ